MKNFIYILKKYFDSVVHEILDIVNCVNYARPSEEKQYWGVGFH